MKAKKLKVGYRVKVTDVQACECIRGTVWSKGKKRILVLSSYGVCSIPCKDANDKNKWRFRLVRRL
jgi:hypothetical protein